MANPGGFRRPWFKQKQPQINLNLVKTAVNFSTEPKHGYYGFNLYFPERSDIKLDSILARVSHFESFIERNKTVYNFSLIESLKFFTVDYKSIMSNDEQLSSQWTDLKSEIINSTELCLNCMGLAMHQTIINDSMKTHNSEDGNLTKQLGIIRARLVNYEPVQQIKEIRVNCYGKLVSVKGTVIKASNTKIIYQYMEFSCSSCTGTQIVKQIDGVFTLPKNCPTDGCNSQSNFNALHSSPHTRTISWQFVKIQEMVGDDQFENGRVPRTVECELTEDLVNCCVPGDDLMLTGVMKVRNSSESSFKNKQSNMLQMYLDVISLVNTKNQEDGSYGASKRITFNISDYYDIQKIHGKPNLFRYLVQSLCPNICGHEVVKAGLLLALFGGTKSEKKRSESHILMVGDPGMGKSQMLHACVNVAPRGVYVCGKTSTGSGLTVTMTRDGGDYSLEAGALMLADQGCCCIDEFDKMPKQHACLLEAMEQQSISIAKAGIVCTLPTRTTILAAANPAGGHYNKARTIAENLKISSPMLSRFDLIFILVDQPNKELDMMMSEHVLAVRSGLNRANSGLNVSIRSTCSRDCIRGRLCVQNDDEVEYLPHNLFRKYIAYAQKYVNPQLSKEAQQVLKEFYFKWRKQFRNGECTPVTTRQLNSLIRLTQARAKIELREEATRKDAMDVVEIMKESLIDIFTDEAGVLDTTRTPAGVGISTKNQTAKLLELMEQAAEAETKSVFTTKELKELSDRAGIPSSKFYNVLDTLCIQCFILNKGGKKYQLVTVDI